MSERLTPWWITEGLGKYAMTDELLALRARVAHLEGVIQTQNGVVVSGTLKLNEARARVAKLEEALTKIRDNDPDSWEASIARAALTIDS